MVSINSELREEEKFKMEMTNASEDINRQVLHEQEKEQEQQQEKDHKGKMKVWVAIDETEGSLYALQWALEHLFLCRHEHHQATGGEEDDAATITIVHVQPPFQPSYTAVGPILFATPSMMESVKKAKDEEEETAAKVIEPALELCKQHMVKAETMVIKGNPKETLVEAVEQMHVDLLVIGSRGLGKIKRVFRGSVSDHCAHHAKCPVLIVRLPKSAHDHEHDDE